MAYTTALMRSMAASRAKALRRLNGKSKGTKTQGAIPTQVGVAVCGGVVLDAAQVESGLAVNADQSVQVDHASG